MGIVADKKLNTVADKIINTSKRRDIIVDKKLNTIANETIDIDKKQDAIAGKQLNAVAQLLLLIKNQIIKQTRLEIG